MLRVFKTDLVDPDHFTVTLELVPGRESTGRSVDTITGIARDALTDGRISAVSITDNPGGNPSLSPDVLGYEIFNYGMDVIVHFTCRDTNRVGMESRALQLAHMGMKNILALTGDYSGKGFGGQGAAVFDFDSVILTSMLKKLNGRLAESGDSDGFFTGCAVSPFKSTQGEIQAQFRKLDLKLRAGSDFIITQLGYDADQFRELIIQNRNKGVDIPVLASLYMLSPRSARAMNRGLVPGAVVSDKLYNTVVKEWQNTREGLKKAVERTARLGVVLKGMGFQGIHIGGIHRRFDTVGSILDRMEEIEDDWQDFVEEFKPERGKDAPQNPMPRRQKGKDYLFEHLPYRCLKTVHDLLFNKQSSLAPLCKSAAGLFEQNGRAWIIKRFLEDPFKKIVLSCRSCGDCAIQHLAFQCPESGCPKHTRNGACGGSREGYCEVNKEKMCVWARGWERLNHTNETHLFLRDFVPPRMWELNESSSWINFHLGKDHQKSDSSESCGTETEPAKVAPA